MLFNVSKRSINVLKAVLTSYILPTTYAGMTYNDTDASKARIKALKAKIDNAPTSGVLAIKGTAGPIVNQLMEAGRKIRGIDFLVRSTTAFEQHDNPMTEVVVLYNVGAEVSLNNKVTSMVLKNIVKYYTEHHVLLIIETDMTKGELLSRYEFSVINHITLNRKEDEEWV